MDALLWFLPVIFLFCYWLDTAEAKETAVLHGRKACKDVNVQFLDDSVVRFRSRFQRNHLGNLCFSRDFRFEFTIDGQTRHNGYIRLLGKRLTMLEMDLPDPEDQDNAHHLILTASYSEDSDALRSRIEKRPDCRD